MIKWEKYRKKPVVIEAIQITGEWFDGNHPNLSHPADRRITYHPGGRYIEIETLEGVMRGNVGDWLIRGIQGRDLSMQE